jgi:hypothetical protein
VNVQQFSRSANITVHTVQDVDDDLTLNVCEGGDLDFNAVGHRLPGS